jgi:GNAT superfamily N-acetyltransferase
MNEQISVLPVRNKKLAQNFVELPFRLYRDDELWVPPLRSDVHKLISPKHNPFFAEADIENFIALDGNGKTVGRISASIHREYNQRFGQEQAFFGLLESEDNAVVTAALFCHVEQWARERGKCQMNGPYSYTSTQDAALLIENIDGRSATVLQTYNPLYYRRLIEQAGYTLATTFSTFGMLTQPTAKTSRMKVLADRARAQQRISVRSASRHDLKNNLDEIRKLFNISFAKNLDVAPISGATFKFAVDSVRPFIELEGIRVIEVDDVPVAFFLILPDLNELLIKLKGSIGLLDLIKLPWSRRAIQKCVVALIGAVPDHYGQGIGRIIMDEMLHYAQSRYQEAHTMWIDDRNPSSYVLAKMIGGMRTKRYGVFHKNLM